VQLDPQFPPPEKVIVPLFPNTVPVLLNAALTVVMAVPPVFSKVPALLNAEAPPPPKITLLSLVWFQTLPTGLLMTALFTSLTEPLVPDHVAVPLLFNVREESTKPAPDGKLIPPFAFSFATVPVMQLTPVSAEQIVPPDQVNVPFRSISPVPANVPAVWVNGPLTVTCPLNASVPPFILMTLATELFVTVKGPAEKVRVPELFNALMV